jgi:hypothetical protein
MNKTHEEVVEIADGQIVNAILSGKSLKIAHLIHPEIVFTNEAGAVFFGIDNLPLNDPAIYRVTSLEIIERSISFFNTVAVVNTLEKRTGLYHEMNFEGVYRLTRVWKFFGKHWQLITASIVQI